MIGFPRQPTEPESSPAFLHRLRTCSRRKHRRYENTRANAGHNYEAAQGFRDMVRKQQAAGLENRAVRKALRWKPKAGRN